MERSEVPAETDLHKTAGHVDVAYIIRVCVFLWSGLSKNVLYNLVTGRNRPQQIYNTLHKLVTGLFTQRFGGGDAGGQAT